MQDIRADELKKGMVVEREGVIRTVEDVKVHRDIVRVTFDHPLPSSCNKVDLRVTDFFVDNKLSLIQRSRIPAIEIRVFRAEGPCRPSGAGSEIVVNKKQEKPGTNIWELASSLMRLQWQDSAPRLGYDKCDVFVTFEDDHCHRFRYDMTHPENQYYTPVDLAAELRREMLFWGGNVRPHHISPEHYEACLRGAPKAVEQAKEFLSRYEIG